MDMDSDMQAQIEAPERKLVLLPFGALCLMILQVALLHAPINKVGSIQNYQRLKTKNGLKCMAYYYRHPENGQEMLVADCPLPDGWKELWSQYANTNMCTRFCVIMGDKIKQGLQDLLGEAVKVRWKDCSPQPYSVLLLRRLYGSADELLHHCVLRITFGYGARYIFDGTAAQYGHDVGDIRFLPEDEYKAKYLLSNVDFRDDAENNRDLVIEDIMEQNYWSAIKKRLDKLWPNVDVARLSKLPMDKVYKEVLTQAHNAFEGAQEEADRN